MASSTRTSVLDESDFASRGAARATDRAAQPALRAGPRPGTRPAASSNSRGQAAGWSGDLEMLFPKSINRLRVKGAGSRYVHGGAALQEVVVPVLQINKKRQSDISLVGVDILRGSTSTITTGQLSVAFYQTEAVTEKVQPRTLRAGIYTAGRRADLRPARPGASTSTSENPREREAAGAFRADQQGRSRQQPGSDPAAGRSRFPTRRTTGSTNQRATCCAARSPVILIRCSGSA